MMTLDSQIPVSRKRHLSRHPITQYAVAWQDWMARILLCLSFAALVMAMVVLWASVPEPTLGQAKAPKPVAASRASDFSEYAALGRFEIYRNVVWEGR